MNTIFSKSDKVNTSYLCNTNSLLLHCFMYTRSVPIINTIKPIYNYHEKWRENRKNEERAENN